MTTVRFVGGVVSALCMVLITGLTFAVPTNPSALYSFRSFIFWLCVIAFLGYGAVFIADWGINRNQEVLDQRRDRRENERDGRYRKLLKNSEETLAVIAHLLPANQAESLLARAADLGQQTWLFLRQQHEAYHSQLVAKRPLSDEEQTRLFDAWGARMKTDFSSALAPKMHTILAEARQQGLDTSDVERELASNSQLPSYVEDVALVFDEFVINGVGDLYHAA
jgi:hypothetical protein